MALLEKIQVKLDEYAPSDKTPNRPLTPPTDISGIYLKECAPYSMRLTPSACALMAERARRTNGTVRDETAPYAIHSAASERQRLRECLACPDAEAASKAAICRTPGCNGTVRYEDGLCTRCWHKERAEERVKRRRKAV